MELNLPNGIIERQGTCSTAYRMIRLLKIVLARYIAFRRMMACYLIFFLFLSISTLPGFIHIAARAENGRSRRPATTSGIDKRQAPHYRDTPYGGVAEWL
jgi:hypothetical protein